MIFTNNLDWFAFGWFCVCWLGYTLYARRMATQRDCLAALLYRYRVSWMRELLQREYRIADVAALGNLIQMVNFMATTTILVLAGVITILYSSENIVNLLSGHIFIVDTTQEQVQFKLFILVLIFVYAFFRFTWSMRQQTFCSIVIGGAPMVPLGRDLTEAEAEFARYLAKISDRASHEFNYGLRSYYFALSLLAWFIHPGMLILSCSLVVLVLYFREFKSKTLTFLIESRKQFEIAQGSASPHP